ncbi:dolichyl-phosphate-mannose-protein mannosyltransferase family protein [Salinisphaera dokdonensis CL-ES53]|uniref:Dolichyl-phosphate-mannose-protein mannosyltransferase family protein n=1 Tax=Salinisphaera dokdonensis CL-ES53 TaxID=1304272 RepID=A0ABV2B097_9GAMM
MSVRSRLTGGAPAAWLAVIVIALLAMAVAGRGMGEIPLESHEIYVAQTAENMLESGDWLVPRLNGEYRLTKPPLSYWLVAGMATFVGQDHVGAGIARAPSVLAVMGVALLALWIGTRLFDRRTGMLAGLLCVASLAAFKYGHNARPDMLYAFWTTAVLAAWVGSRQASVATQARWAWALWVLVGFATLTKGPQAPLILLLGLSLHAVLSDERAVDLWRRLRPVRGLLIVLALVVPWYLLLRQAIGGQTLGDSQLSGALLTIDPWRLFTPFYLLRAPMLWLPWALLLPAAVLLAWRDRRRPAGLLACTIVFAMLAFALGPQYREIYMLPWLAPAMLLLAAAITRVAWARVCVGLVIAVVGVALVWLVYEAGLTALLMAAAGLLLVAGAVWALRRRQTPAAAALVAAAFAVGLFQGGAVPNLWSSARYEELVFVESLSRHVDPEMPIVVWDIDAAHYSYYLERPVKGLEAIGAVCDWIGRQGAATLLIYPRQRRHELVRRLAFEPLLADNDSEFAATRLPPGTACRAPQNAGA